LDYIGPGRVIMVQYLLAFFALVITIIKAIIKSWKDFKESKLKNKNEIKEEIKSNPQEDEGEENENN